MRVRADDTVVGKAEAAMSRAASASAAFFDMAEQIKNAMDTVEATMGAPEGLPAAIRNLVTLSRQTVTTYEQRYEIFNGSK